MAEMSKILQFVRKYNIMGAGTLSIILTEFEEDFEIILRHIPTGRMFDFRFSNDITYEEFQESMNEVISEQMRGSGMKGMAS